MRLLLDEMHSPAVATRLRALGHDVMAVKEHRTPTWVIADTVDEQG